MINGRPDMVEYRLEEGNRSFLQMLTWLDLLVSAC